MAALGGAAIDLSGRRILITGATNGIGRAAAEALAAMGASVILHGRDPAAVEATRRSIAAIAGSDRVSGFVADFGSLSAVRRLAAELQERYACIDVLLNNAGGFMSARRTTVDGYEWTFGVNHLAPFLLTNLLLPMLQKGAKARVVTVASEAHRRASIAFDDLQLERGRYAGFRAYGQSKLANILFTLELSRRLRGTNVTANSLHPGVVATNIFSPPGAIGALVGLLARLFFMPAARGAQTSVYLAASQEVGDVSGRYFARCRETAPAPAATDPAAAARLWEVSERLVAVRR